MLKGKIFVAALLCLTLAMLVPRALAAPTVESYNQYTVQDDVFLAYEAVYCKGTGYQPLVEVCIYVVPDRNWVDGDPITGSHTHAITTPTGELPFTNLGGFPAGTYDIVIDVDCDGIFDAATDAVDKAVTIGFTAIGGIVVGVNKIVILAPYIGLASIAAVGAVVALKYRRKKE